MSGTGKWLLIAALCHAAPAATAQSTVPDTVLGTIGGGGGHVAGGQFVVSSAIAQPEATVGIASGGQYAIRGGALAVSGAAPAAIFSDGFESGN